MNDLTIFLILLLVLGVWGAIVYVTSRSAIAKGRSGWIWGILTIFPLGPVTGPLFLLTMPKLGAAASKGQLIGRTVIVAFLVFAFLFRLIENSVPAPNELSSDELNECLDLSEQARLVRQSATLNEGTNMWEFPTQESADKYNLLIERFQDECSGKTYDEKDLQNMQRNFGEP